MRANSSILFSCRRSITLIELLIAISLVAILLTALMGIYQQLMIVQKESDKARRDNFHIRYLHHRLGDLLSKNLPEKVKEQDYYFYTEILHNEAAEGLSLVFMYDNGIDIDPRFSNHVLGRLYLDNNRQLCLATWPSPSQWSHNNPPMKKEILLSNVENFSFSFYQPSKSDKNEVTPRTTPLFKEEIEPNEGQWNLEWPLNYPHLPPMMKIIVKRNVAHGMIKPSEEVVLTIMLPKSKKHIVYNQ